VLVRVLVCMYVVFVCGWVDPYTRGEWERAFTTVTGDNEELRCCVSCAIVHCVLFVLRVWYFYTILHAVSSFDLIYYILLHTHTNNILENFISS